ncbi:MAG: hypothetical protein MK010_04245 [Erythrobacter sp.]|nr:hypothetical protein [Erythrobacter sp.]
MRIAPFALGILAIATAAGAAAPAVSITRSVFVETLSDDGVELEPATRLERGDKVVLVMQWERNRAQRPFTLASRVPEELAFQRSGDASVEVSINGGRRWGRLGDLRSGQRLASPEDVTHLRWRIAAGDDRRLRSYSAIVR